MFFAHTVTPARGQRWPCERYPTTRHDGDRMLPDSSAGWSCRTLRDCAHVRVAYNSCRNRHCPKCSRGRRPQLGSRRAKRNCCPYPISTWYSRFRRLLERSRFKTRPWSIDCCSKQHPRLSVPLRLIPNILVPTSALLPSFIHGARSSITILTYIASFLLAAFRPMATDGLRSSAGVSFRSGFYRGSSEDCFSNTSPRRSRLVS